MPIEREVRERERAAYIKGAHAGGKLTEYYGETTTAAIIRMVDMVYPLPPAKIWKCRSCGAVVTEVILVADGCPGNVTYWHRGSGNVAYCGLVEEMEEVKG